MNSPASRPSAHESGHLHVTGRARYVADMAGPPGTLFVLPVPSPVAHGQLHGVHADDALRIPGVRAVLTAADIPGDVLWGPIQHSEPLLAQDRVEYAGQALALVVAEDEASARAGADALLIEITEKPPLLSIRQALAARAFHTRAHVIARGDLDAAFAQASDVVSAELLSPAQDHFYLETQAALVLPEDDGSLRVLSSTQHPTEVQKVIARALQLPAGRVVVEVPRMGGGFGGKESQASPYAAYAALAAVVTGRPCRCWLHRDQDMAWTGKRHPFLGRYRAAFDAEGRILGFQAQLWSDGGWSVDLSGPVMDRALFHLDGPYHLPALRLEGQVCRTHLPSNTAFRGFGGPQGMLLIEDAIDRLAARRGVDPTALRRLNLYGEAPRDRTPYGQVVEENRLPRLVPELLDAADYAARQAEIAAFNARSPHAKRALGFQAVKFGISFTASLLNQAGALVQIYTDGSVQVNHGGTEMGQGLHTKMLAVAAAELGLPLSRVRIMRTATDKVPNTSATAASSGSDLNGAALAAACRTLKARMAAVAVESLGGPAEALRFSDAQVHGPSGSMPFAALAELCWARQISLSTTGFYATPGIQYDPAAGRGTPFYYYAFGGALSEVEVCGWTGAHHLRRVDILHDVGDSLVHGVDVGQVEGGFVQGLGWLTCEDFRYRPDGRALTTGPSTYKIPSAGDVPRDLRVALLDRAPNAKVIGGSKAVGEPPFMLAISALNALRAAIAAFGPGGREVELALPATPEAVFMAIEGARG